MANEDVVVRIGATSAALDQEMARLQSTARQAAQNAGRQFKAFNTQVGLNRAGLMELRAAGVNSFQALAAGMNPLTVAMMEGAQVIGALVQGGISLGGVIRAATSPFGLMAAAVAGVGAAYVVLNGVVRASAHQADLNKQVQDALTLTLDSEATSVKALKEKYAELTPVMRQLYAITTADALQKAQAKLDNLQASASEQMASMQTALQALSGPTGDFYSSSQLKSAMEASAADMKQVTDQVQAALDEFGKTGRVDQLAVSLANITSSSKAVQDALTSTSKTLLKEGIDASKTHDQIKRLTAELDLLRGLAKPGELQIFGGAGSDADKLTQKLAQLAKETGEARLETLALSQGYDKQSIAIMKTLYGMGLLQSSGQLIAGLTEKQVALVTQYIAKQQELGDVQAAAAIKQKGAAIQTQILNSQAEEAGRIYLNTRTPLETYNAEVEHYTELLKAGALDQDVYNRAVAKAKDTLDKASDSTKGMKDAARQLGLTFDSAFENAIVQGQSLSKVLQGIEQDLIRIAVRQTITQPAANFLTQALPMIFSLFHSGGTVGSGQGVSRTAPGPLTLAAPRLHGGLGADEFPAILQKGETVTPKGAGGLTVNVFNNSSAKVSAREVPLPSGGRRLDVMVEETVAKSLDRAGSRTSQAMERNFALNRATISR